jgi:acyl-coenzyme A synthetase/AMP-(fatty) acid ligase
VVHCTGGYMVYTYTTSKYVFNMSEVGERARLLA